MSTWSAGYNVDVDYTYGYYVQLNPARVTIPFLLSGLTPPKISNCCELGFGQGMSLNLHCAASKQSWWGNDFMPNQVAFAERLSDGCEKKPILSDDSFEDYVKRDDLPKFDYIGLHGIWSWVSDENRKNIARFIEKNLNVGGVVYMSYNALPGWSDFVSVRDIMLEHANRMSPESLGIVDKIESSKGFLKSLINTEPKFLNAIPGVKGRLEKIDGQSGNYLVHEYFNSDWCPMHFSDVSRELEASKLSWACSGDYKSYFDFINLSSEQTRLIQTIEDRSFRETVRDYITNQQFRMDYWVRGAVKISEAEKIERFGELRVMPIRDFTEHKVEISGAHARVELGKEKYGKLYELLKPLKVYRIGDIIKATEGELTKAEVATAVTILNELQVLHLVTDGHEDSEITAQCMAINKNISGLNKPGMKVSVMACPLTGGAMGVSHFEQLFLEANWAGEKTAKKLTDYTLEVLMKYGQSVTKEGKALDSKGAHELVMQKANNFNESNKPIYQALGML